MTPIVRIARISHAYDFCEWLCEQCAATLRKRGWEIRLGDIVGWPCDRCGK